MVGKERKERSGGNKYEPLINWARRTRDTYFQNIGRLYDPQFRPRPLIIELDGMPGTGKSYFRNWLYQVLMNDFQVVLQEESTASVFEVNRFRTSRREFREAELKLLSKRLEEYYGGESDLILFDRGLLDSVMWLWMDIGFYRSGTYSEYKDKFESIFSEAKGKVDLIFLRLGDTASSYYVRAREGAARGKESLPFRDSFGSDRGLGEAEVLRRYKAYQIIYEEEFLKKDSQVRQVVKEIFPVDVDERGRETSGRYRSDYRREVEDYRQANEKLLVLTIFYLVFKAWESVLLVYPGLSDEKLDPLVQLLRYPFNYLRKIIENPDNRELRDLVLDLVLECSTSSFTITQWKGKKIRIKSLHLSEEQPFDWEYK